MKKILVIILLTMGAPAFAGHQTKSFLVQFATDEHALDPVALQKLDEVNAYLKAHPTAKIKLTGRTDFDGTVDYNLTLSRLRTTEVAEYLKTKGWKNAEINEKWVGELKPLAANSDDEGKAMNRSVEILITILNYDNASQWIKEQQDGYERVFKLSRSGENTITTENETVINIPGASFVGPDGKLVDNKNVKLVIKEVSTALDAILNQVYTTSGGQLLETGGMINIAAYNNTTPLQMADGKEISVQIPTKSDKADMFVFEGVADKDGNIDWKNTGKKFAPNAKQEMKPTRLNEDILQALINQVELDEPAYRDLFLTYTLPKEIKKPSKPKEPKKPEKPEAKTLFSKLGWILSTSGMRKKKVESVYKTEMAAYEKRMKANEKRMATYKKALEAYEAELANLETENQKFDDWVEQAKNRVVQEKTEWKDYFDKKRIVSSLTEISNASKKGTLFTNYPMGLFKSKAVNAQQKDIEAELMRLKNIEYTLSTLSNEDIAGARKNYSVNDEVDVYSLSSKTFKKVSDYSFNSDYYNNPYLESFISGNKTDLEKVFGDEVSAHYKMKEQQSQIAKSASAQQYFTGNSKAGWINCDRFVNEPMVRMNATMVPGACQVVILKNINSVLPTLTDAASAVNYASIPQNTKFKLLTLKIEGDQGYIAINEGTAQKGMTLEPKFKKVPLEEITQMLAKI